MQIEGEHTPINILFEGPFDPNLISVKHSNETIRHTRRLDDHIERTWNDYLNIRPGAYNNPLVLVISSSYDQSGLILVTGVTDFKERVTTQTASVKKEFGESSVATTLGVGILPITADNKLILAQVQYYHRSKMGGLHNLGGLVDPSKDIDEGSINLAKAARREASEETGLNQNEFVIDACSGGIQSKESFAIDILFRAKTNLTKADILKRSGDGEVSLIFIDNDPEAVRYLLLRNLKTVTSPCIGSLYLYGKQIFGLDWAKFVVERFARRQALYATFSPETSEKARARLERQLPD